MHRINEHAASTAKSTEPDWYRAYFLAMVESDRSKALLEIERAQKAIQERALELRLQHQCDSREMQDLTSALTYLGILLLHSSKESGNLLWD